MSKTMSRIACSSFVLFSPVTLWKLMPMCIVFIAK